MKLVHVTEIFFSLKVLRTGKMMEMMKNSNLCFLLRESIYLDRKKNMKTALKNM